jgi:hypothetical protein
LILTAITLTLVAPQSKTITISRDINHIPFRNDNDTPAAINATT